jgi:hypothetical protein
MIMSRSSYFFAPPNTDYRSLTLTTTYNTLNIQDSVAERTDDRFTRLSKDAATFKIARTKLDDQRRLLRKAGTIASNISTQILKHEKQITRFDDLLARSNNDIARAGLIEKQQAANAALQKAKQRQAAVAKEIPRIEAALNQLQSNNAVATQNFIQHYPRQFWLYKKMYQSFLAVELSFTPYILKTVGLSVISCTDAWHLPNPTPHHALLAALPFALMDFLVNVLLFDPHATAVHAQFEFYEKYKFKSYQRIFLDSIQDTASAFSLTALAMGLLNTLSLETHNIIGGASTIYGVKDYWPFDVIGDWQLVAYIPMLIAAVGYYRVAINPKYYAGMQDNQAYRQVLNTILKLFSADFPRAFDVLYRGIFSNALLRALSFYFLAVQVRDMSPYLSFVNPLAVFALVFHHSIASRYGKAYEPSFGKKEHELVQIFVDLKIKKAREQVMAQRLEPIYQELVTLNNARKPELRKPDSHLKASAKNKLERTLVTSVLEDIELEALKLAAGMNLSYVHDARLTNEREQQRARIRIQKKAQSEAAEYLQDQTKELMELRTWEDFANDLRSSLVIGSLRGLFGYILMSTYGMLLVETVAGEHLSHDTAEYVKYSSSVTMALLFFIIYFNSCKQAELDARVVACHTDDHINEVAEIVAADDATEKALEEEKEAKASPALHPVNESKTPELMVLTIPNLSPRPESKAEDSPHQVNMRVTLMVSNVAKVMVTGGSCVIRVVSNVYPTIFPFIGFIDEMDLVSLITVSLAEGSALNYNVFIDDVNESILSHLTRSKFFQSLITTQSRVENTVVRNNTVSTFHRVWSIFKSSSPNEQPPSDIHEGLPLLPSGDSSTTENIMSSPSRRWGKYTATY